MDTELTNWKCGIDVLWGTGDGSDKGVAYYEEYFFHDKLVDDHKVVFLKSDTLIHFRHNARNTAIYGLPDGGRRTIGENGLDGIADSGDEGIIRFKIDRDRQDHLRWSQNFANSYTSRLIPAYSGPFALEDLEYESGIPVVGTTGHNGGSVTSHSARYYRGLTDAAGNEWHTLAYADDDSAFLRVRPSAVDQKFWSSDGKTTLLVVNPKTPCLTTRVTGTGQFYTTPPKAYWTPKIVPQTTYLAAGSSGTVTIELRDIYGNNVHYRINGGAYTDAGGATVTLDQDDFSEGENTLEYYYAGNEGFVASRTVVKNPIHPSKVEAHGNFLWETETAYDAVLSRITRAPYLGYYNSWKTRGDTSGQTYWDSFAMQGLRYTGSSGEHSNGHINSYALKNAFIAKVEGPAYKRTGAPKSCMAYAREMLLDQPDTIDLIGWELQPSGETVPSRDINTIGYYDCDAAEEAIFAYDIMVANFRDDQVSGGITAIEDYFVRDVFAKRAFAAMQVVGGMRGGSASYSPGMWGGAHIILGTCIAMVMPEYSTPYYGTSGFGAVQNTFPICPFENDEYTWKEALFDPDTQLSTYPNLTWRLGISDNGVESLFLGPGVPGFKEGDWWARSGYFSYALMGRRLLLWANMAKLYGAGRTDPRLELAINFASEGTLTSYYDTVHGFETQSRYHVLTALNKRWPQAVENGMDWVKSLPLSDANSPSKAMQDAGVFGIAWYDDAALVGVVATPSANPDGGYFEEVTAITLACPTPGATIHYTTNGAAPTTSSPVYSSPIELTSSATIKALAVKDGSENSSILSVSYVVDASGRPAPPADLVITSVFADLPGDLATGYTLTGPASGRVGSARTFTISAVGGVFVGTEVFTPVNTGLTGTFSAATVTPAAGSSSVLFEFTGSALGSGTIGVTDDQGWTDPAALAFTVAAPSSSSGGSFRLRLGLGLGLGTGGSGGAAMDADATVFQSALATQSYSIPQSRISAYSRFIKAAKANGYWGKIIDCGAMEGETIAAACVKLKTTGGYPATLTNTGFTDGDLLQNGGLQGAASGKYLSTGINYNTLTSGLGGLAFWMGDNETSAATTKWMIGVGHGSSPQLCLDWGNNASPSPGLRGRWGGSLNSPTINGTTLNKGFYHVERTALDELRLYANGVPSARLANAVTNATRSAVIGVFANGTGQIPSDNKGLFYAITDGTMSDNDAAAFASDVGALMRSLGRVTPDPLPLDCTIIVGQSLAIGAQGSPALSTTQPYECRRFESGVFSGHQQTVGIPAPSASGTSGTLSPLTEATVETIASGLANGVAAAHRAAGGDASRDMLISAWGVGGFAYSQLAKGTVVYANSIAAIAHAKLISPLYRSGAFRVPAVVCVHGEQDFGNGGYQANLETWQADYEADIRAITGQTGRIPMLVSQPSSWTKYTMTTAASPYGILAAHVQDATRVVLVCPKYFLPYAADGVHLTNAGYRWLGEYYAKAWYQHIVQGVQWEPLRPSSVVRSGVTITVSFAGRVGSLVLDTTRVSDPGNYGFEWAQTGGTARTISSIVLSADSTQVIITLSGDPGSPSSQRLRYAYTGVSGNSGGPTAGPRGCLRDSDPATSRHGSDLSNWCVHFNEVVTGA